MIILRNFLKLGILITGIIFACSCNNHSNEQVSKFYDLVANNQLDSARKIKQNIKYSRLNDEGKAIYGIAITSLDFKEIKVSDEDTLINYSIQYYTSIGDHINTANAYFYRACNLYDRKQTKDAFTAIKQAEHEIKHGQDIDIKHKILEKIADWNIDAEEYTIALKYAKENLQISIQKNDENWLAYAYAYMALSYNGIGNQKLSNEYLEKTIPHISKVAEVDKASFYALIGNYYFDQGNYEDAFKIYNKSLEIEANGEAYYGLAQINYYKGNYLSSEAYLNKALEASDPKLQVRILTGQAKVYENAKDFKKAYQITQRINKINKQINNKQKEEEVAELQHQYDINLEKLNQERTIAQFIVLLCIILVIIVIYFVYSKNKESKLKQQFVLKQLLINQFNEKIQVLQNSNKSQSEEVEALQQKISTLQEEQSSVLYKGRLLYESIVAGGNVVTWKKNDFEQFIEYYKLIDLPFLDEIERLYSNLNSRYEFVLILKHMGKNDLEISNIMATSSGAIRTMKSRIKQHKR